MRHWCLAIPGVLGLALAAAGGEPTVKIGMVQGMFRDVQPSMVQALARPFRSLMEKQSGMTGDVTICADAACMADKLRDKALDLGVFHGFEYAWVKQQNADFVPLVVAHPQGGLVQGCVLVRADSTAKTLTDLDGTVIIPRGAKAHCLVYLEKLRTSATADKKIQGKSTMLTPEEALNGLTNGEHSAVLLDAAAWTGYQGLQPGAAKQLRVLCRSDRFPPSVLVHRKGALDAELLNRLRTGLTTAHQTAQYKPLMLLWNLKGFDDVPSDYNAQLEQCLRQYPSPTIRTSVVPSDPAK